MADVPAWRVQGDWFDVCNCRIPRQCTFAQAPSEGDCAGILAWHINEGNYGDAELDGLNVVGLGTFTGNIWAGEAKPVMGMYMDERADEDQRGALLSRGSRQVKRTGRGVDRANFTSRRTCPGSQPVRGGGRPGPDRDLGYGDHEPRRWIRLQMGVGRPFEQAFPLRLGRPRRMSVVTG